MRRSGSHLAEPPHLVKGTTHGKSVSGMGMFGVVHSSLSNAFLSLASSHLLIPQSFRTAGKVFFDCIRKGG